MKRRNFLTAILAACGVGGTGHLGGSLTSPESTPAPPITSGYVNTDSSDQSTITFEMTNTSSSAMTWVNLS